MKENDTNKAENLYLFSKQLQLPTLAKQFSDLMDEEGITMAELLEGLAEERLAIYQENYGDSCEETQP
jgi:hypothetical protein